MCFKSILVIQICDVRKEGFSQFAIVLTGLPASGGRLAENHPGAFISLRTARRHANVAQIRKSLQKKQAFG